nr:DDE endonuclease [Streptomyces brasiliscabiei]
MTCYKPGERSRLVYSVREHTGRKDQATGFGWRDSPDLLIRARIQLGGPIVLVRDNVRLHLTKPCGSSSKPTRTGSRSSWSLVKRDIGNLTAADLSQITRAVKRKLKMLQYRPEVFDGCLADTTLVLGT